MTNDGVDLLTVVMHELGHLLGYEHSDAPDDLMAPVLSPSSPRSSSLILHPSSRPDDVFAELGNDLDSQDNSATELLESRDEGLLVAAATRPSEEATQARIPRRSRLQRYERDLDAWFAELAAEEAGQ